MQVADSTEREILTPIPPTANNRMGRSVVIDGIYDEDDSEDNRESGAASPTLRAPRTYLFFQFQPRGVAFAVRELESKVPDLAQADGFDHLQRKKSIQSAS